jgi:hypothetical protein
MNELGVHAACMEEMRNTRKILYEKLEDKRQLGRPRCRWIVNINMDINEVRCKGIDSIHLTQDTGPVTYSY